MRRKEKLSYIALFDFATVFFTFGMLYLFGGGKVASVFWAPRSADLLGVAVHSVALSVALLALVGWAGGLAAGRDNFYLTEMAHKGLYQLHVALVAACVVCTCLGFVRGWSCWGVFIGIGLFAFTTLQAWRAAYHLIRSLREKNMGVQPF